jgi:hypothetical protein
MKVNVTNLSALPRILLGATFWGTADFCTELGSLTPEGLRRFANRGEELTIVDLRMEEEEFALRSLQQSTIVTHQSMCALPPDGSTAWRLSVQKSALFLGAERFGGFALDAASVRAWWSFRFKVTDRVHRAIRSNRRY